MAGKSMVSSLSMTFKKVTQVTEDREQAKKEHREKIKTLLDKYFEDVPKGKAEGIRTAKELVEVMKLDLLLMGEATERTDDAGSIVDEAQVLRVQQIMDMDSPEVQAIMKNMYAALNGANDDLDNAPIQVSSSANAPEGVDRSELFNEIANENNSTKAELPIDDSASV